MCLRSKRGKKVQTLPYERGDEQAEKESIRENFETNQTQQGNSLLLVVVFAKVVRLALPFVSLARELCALLSAVDPAGGIACREDHFIRRLHDLERLRLLLILHLFLCFFLLAEKLLYALVSQFMKTYYEASQTHVLEHLRTA